MTSSRARVARSSSPLSTDSAASTRRRSSARAEERLLVLAAESVESGDEERATRALEEVIEANPRSWRAHYTRAELLRQIGETNLAIVGLEQAHALHPLRDA